MTIGQDKLIKNYNSLMNKLNDKSKISEILIYCTLFQNDDLDLFMDFIKDFDVVTCNYNFDSISTIYSKIYGITDKKEILKRFINNAINEGVSYHIGSSANYISIMEHGLGLSNYEPEEVKDYKLLVNGLGDKTKRVLPFNNKDYGKKLCYSCRPILSSRYGSKPEWLMELELNCGTFDSGSPERELIDHILNKYEKKYSRATKVLFITPNLQISIPSQDIDRLVNSGPEDVIFNILTNNFLVNKDMSSDKTIDSSNLIMMDFKTFKLGKSLDINELSKIY